MKFSKIKSIVEVRWILIFFDLKVIIAKYFRAKHLIKFNRGQRISNIGFDYDLIKWFKCRKNRMRFINMKLESEVVNNFSFLIKDTPIWWAHAANVIFLLSFFSVLIVEKNNSPLALINIYFSFRFDFLVVLRRNNALHWKLEL